MLFQVVYDVSPNSFEKQCKDLEWGSATNQKLAQGGQCWEDVLMATRVAQQPDSCIWFQMEPFQRMWLHFRRNVLWYAI